MAIWSSFALLVSRDRLAASLFLRRRSQYASSFCSSGSERGRRLPPAVNADTEPGECDIVFMFKMLLVDSLVDGDVGMGKDVDDLGMPPIMFLLIPLSLAAR